MCLVNILIVGTKPYKGTDNIVRLQPYYSRLHSVPLGPTRHWGPWIVTILHIAPSWRPAYFCSDSCGLSVGTLTFGWYPVWYLDLRLTPRVSTLNSHAWPHLEGTCLESYRLSHLPTHSPTSSHTPRTASASSLWFGIYCFWILDLCSPGQSQLTRLN